MAYAVQGVDNAKDALDDAMDAAAHAPIFQSKIGFDNFERIMKS